MLSLIEGRIGAADIGPHMLFDRYAEAGMGLVHFEYSTVCGRGKRPSGTCLIESMSSTVKVGSTGDSALYRYNTT